MGFRNLSDGRLRIWIQAAVETNLLRVSRRVHPRRVSETAAGWAFFNINGYLGTVTPEGEGESARARA
jgi:hypothetical protein